MNRLSAALFSCVLTLILASAWSENAPAAPVEYVRAINTTYGSVLGAGESSTAYVYSVEGTVSPDCGYIYKLNSVTLSKVVIRHFSANDPDGCIVLDVTPNTDAQGKTYYLVTMAGGKYLFLDPTGKTLSSISVPGKAVGATRSATALGAPAPVTPSVAAYFYLTVSSGNGSVINGAVYQSSVTTAGILSAPKLIFTFPGGAGGASPGVPAVVGPGGALYGPTLSGGSMAGIACQTAGLGCGIVYRLRPVTAGGVTTWHEDILRTFTGAGDGNEPNSELTFDAAGNLYGTTLLGGDASSLSARRCVGAFSSHLGCGTVFKLTKAAAVPWPETVLHRFHDGGDGALPYGPVKLDSAGNVLGTAIAGGKTLATPCTSTALGGQTPGCGVVFRLKAPAWTESELHMFSGGSDGAQPAGPLGIDKAGNIWGATYAGGYRQGLCKTPGGGLGWASGCGVVFEIKP